MWVDSDKAAVVQSDRFKGSLLRFSIFVFLLNYRSCDVARGADY